MARKAGRRSNGEGTVYQRPDGIWCAQITIGQKADGKPHRKALYASTKAGVLEKKRQADATLVQGLPLGRQDITIEKLMEEYLKDTAPGLRPKTMNSYRQLSRIHIVPHLGNVRVAKLSAREVTHWQQAILSQGKSSQTVSLARSCLSRALDMAVRYDWVGRNVVQSTRGVAVNHRSVPVLDGEDASLILAAFAGSRWEGIVGLMVGCGLRISEALGVCWSDIDMEARTLKVSHQLSYKSGGNSGEFALSSPKTKKGHRTVNLPLFVVETLHRHRSEQLATIRSVAEAEETWGNPWGLCFTCGMGQPIAYRNVLRQFHLIATRAGYPEVTQHDLRHLHASLLAEQGVDMKTLSEQLGHSQINVTDRYTHLIPGGAQSRLGDVIEQALQQRRQKA